MPVGDRTTFDSTNELCSKCGKPMGWTEGILNNGGGVDQTRGRYACIPCGTIGKETESRAVLQGKKDAETVKFKNPGQVSRSLGGSVGRQLGYYRARQHCRTCKNAAGDPCTCNGKCNCLYCRIRRGEAD